MRCQPAIFKQIHHASACAGLGVLRSEHNPPDARVLNRTRAHHAWLKCDVKITTRQTVIA